MAELVGGAFLSSFLKVAFGRLASPDFLDYFRLRKMDAGLLRKLEVILISVNKVIEDAEERQYRDRYVKQWLDGLKHEVFNAQDLLDDVATEALRHKLHAGSQNVFIGKVRGFFTALVNRNQFDKEIESGIQGVLNILEYLLKQNDILGLREGPSAGIQLVVNRKVYQRLPTTRLIDGSDMCGRDADIDTIVEKLLSHSTGGNHQLPMDVIAITGMGGMGKTTLARLVYEDGRMKDQFQHRAWVCVSEEFDIDRVTKEIFCSLSCPRNESDDLHSRQRKIKETLRGKKFFLVLDDVWNENHKIWEVFQAPLKHAAPQSKILITTRNQKVADVMCCKFTHPLKPLQGEDCWNLFTKHAFDNQHHAADPDLERIGRKIVDKCRGLPLAIKTLASLLHRKHSSQYWDKIEKSDLWELSENDSNIIPSLRLSYHYLPSSLKRCFAYCSIFPKDYDIEKNDLIQLWMADGLIYPTQKSMTLEEAGNEMFNDLESRSFFEPSRNGDDYFTMHDLVNDLAKSVTQDFFVQQELGQGQDISIKARYFSLCKISGNHEVSEEVFKCDRLRTFLLLNTGISDWYDLNVDIMSKFSRLKYIRELSLRGCESFTNLTEGISNLKHLHYLDLSWTSVGKLPNSMCLLINLQTLKLKLCQKLTKLPSNFYKLINLRHLDLEGCGIKKMPKYMGKLNQLRTMNKFVAAKEGGSNIKELGALKNLTGSLTISNMKCIKDAADMREANLKEKQLHTLKLRYLQHQVWRYNYSREEAQHEEQVLKALKPNHNVKDLTVEDYGGNKFPKWLADVSHLVSLVLRDCPNIESLPPLGQLPSLQKLMIEGLHGIKVIGEEFYGNGSSIAPFPRLSYLSFDNMREWEEWDICYEGESFPCLEELHIRRCSRLKKSLPHHLPCLKTLLIEGCKNLEALELSHNVKHLAVEGYGSNKFPNWPADGSHFLPNLVSLVLRDCPTIESLPPLGQLPSLQELTIRGLNGIKVIGEEFYGNGSSIAPFPRLSYLSFDNMREWEEWDICYEGESFPCLEELHISWCSRLKKSLPHHLPCLKTLLIEGCKNLEALELSHNVKHLAVEGYGSNKFPNWPADGSHFLPNLVSLVLRDCPTIESLPPLGQLPSLQELTIRGLNGIKVIGEEFYGNGSSIAPFPRLSYLSFDNMREWEEWDICYEGESFPCLEELHISWCSRLKKSLPHHLPCLKTLLIEGCKNLEALELSHNVKHLAVEGYGSNKFPNWPADGSHFLPNLVSLVLRDCPTIESLPPLGQLPSLQKLTIRGLNGIKVIGEEFYGNGSSIAPFPRLSYLSFDNMREWEEWDICYEGESFPCLEELHISWCSRLKKSLPHHLPCLKTLHIDGCRNLETTLPKSSCMEKLSLQNCGKITVKDMPTWSSSDVLPPLHDLKLYDCRAMESLPQGGMLSSLQRLSIKECSSKVIESGRHWGLHELLSLKQLQIVGLEGMECFPEEGLLPPNLQSPISFILDM